MGIEVMGKMGMVMQCLMGIGGNGNDSMGVEREWEQESHSRTPGLLITSVSLRVS